MERLGKGIAEECGLALACLTSLAGAAWAIHDAVFLSAVILGLSLVISRRQWQAWVVGGCMLAAGLFWSYSDASGCSAWWRGAVVYRKLEGNLPLVPWSQIRSFVLGPCYGTIKLNPRVEGTIQALGEGELAGRKCQLFQTGLGQFWVPVPGWKLLSFLVWELNEQQVYESNGVTIRPGDTVIDCGAHVGLFTKYALIRGARRVVAIEPDPTNLACLKVNLEGEIASGQVVVVAGGIWDRRAVMTLWRGREGNSAASSFVAGGGADAAEGISVIPLDEIVAELHLERVDFVKMDIEGAERFGLQGALMTLRDFRPRMAISSYHLPGDERVILALARSAQPAYRVHAKNVETQDRWVRSKVLFFE